MQDARALLSGRASEIFIGVASSPLASCPDAIEAVSPLIDEGTTDEAKAAFPQIAFEPGGGAADATVGWSRTGAAFGGSGAASATRLFHLA